MVKNNQKGFTLVELLVVIAIISVLASIVMVSLNSARARSRDAARIQAIGQINKAIELYITDTGAAPDLGDISCLDVNSPNADCVADEAVHPDNWDQLASQLRPYISKLEPDPCPNCSALAPFGVLTAYAKGEDTPYGYVYQAPAGAAAYLLENGLSINGLNTEGYRIYAKKLEKQNAFVGYGFGLNGVTSGSMGSTSGGGSEPLQCPKEMGDKECDAWLDQAQSAIEKCNDGDEEACNWLRENGIDPKGGNSDTPGPTCPYGDEDSCRQWQGDVDNNLVKCNDGDEEACNWLRDNGIPVPGKDEECNWDTEKC